MNDKQKIFVMVAVGSFVVLLITIFGLGFDGTRYIPLLEKDWFSYQYFFKDNDKTNWLGIIAVFNVVVSITGYFLFKDK